MSFIEVVDQVIELLQRRGRVTYRARKREFDLDDEYIEDLKEEIIEGQELAGGCAIKIVWWRKGMNNPTSIPIRDRAGHDVHEGNRVKDKAVAQDDAEATIDDVVGVDV